MQEAFGPTKIVIVELATVSATLILLTVFKTDHRFYSSFQANPKDRHTARTPK